MQAPAHGGDLVRGQALDGQTVDLLGEGHQLVAQGATLIGQEYIDVLAIVRPPLAGDITQLLHGVQGGEGGRLHDPRQFAEFALSEALAHPQDAQKGPVAGGDPMFGQPHLQAAAQPPSRIADQMGQPVVRHSCMPVQNGLGDAGAQRFLLGRFRGVAHAHPINARRPERDQKTIA